MITAAHLGPAVETELGYLQPPSLTSLADAPSGSNSPQVHWYTNRSYLVAGPPTQEGQQSPLHKRRRLVTVEDRGSLPFPYPSEDDWVNEIEKEA